MTLTPAQVQQLFHEYQAWAERVQYFIQKMLDSKQLDDFTDDYLRNILESKPCPTSLKSSSTTLEQTSMPQ